MLANVCTDFELALSYPFIRNKQSFGDLWSPSYSAKSCGGASISVIYMYIYQPPAPHLIEGQKKEGCAFRAYILARNGEVLRANPIKHARQPLHQALREACKTIQDMPARYLSHPDGSNILAVTRHGRAAGPKHLLLDEAYMSSFGHLRLPQHLYTARLTKTP